MKFFTFSVFVTIIACLSGCSGEKTPDGMPKLYPAVCIKVVQDGNPLEDAYVSLRPEDKSLTWGIGGKTDAQGVAQLWTHGKYKGAFAGTFKVMVSKKVHEGEKEFIEALARNDEKAAASITVRSFSFIEDKFGSESQTPLTLEITSTSKTLEVDVSPAVKNEKPYMK